MCNFEHNLLIVVYCVVYCMYLVIFVLDVSKLSVKEATLAPTSILIESMHKGVCFA